MTEDVDESVEGAGAGRLLAAREVCHHWGGDAGAGAGRTLLAGRGWAGSCVAGAEVLLGARHQASGSWVLCGGTRATVLCTDTSTPRPPRSASRHQPPHSSLNPAQPSQIHS